MLRYSPFGDTSNTATVALTKNDVLLLTKTKRTYFFQLVAKLHVMTQIQWRYLMFLHMGCCARSSIEVLLALFSLLALLVD
jgi:hypothetical protein